MHSRAHAIAVVGYDWRVPLNTGVPGLRYAWDEVQSLAVADDNYLPYMKIPAKQEPRIRRKTLIPLLLPFQRRFLSCRRRLTASVPRFSNSVLWSVCRPQDETIIRYFITTGSALRSFATQIIASEFDPKLLTTIMTLPFAQFVWIVEFATETQWAVGQVEARGDHRRHG